MVPSCGSLGWLVCWLVGLGHDDKQRQEACLSCPIGMISKETQGDHEAKLCRVRACSGLSSFSISVFCP